MKKDFVLRKKRGGTNYRIHRLGSTDIPGKSQVGNTGRVPIRSNVSGLLKNIFGKLRKVACLQPFSHKI